jgi:hypothetical protein
MALCLVWMGLCVLCGSTELSYLDASKRHTHSPIRKHLSL